MKQVAVILCNTTIPSAEEFALRDSLRWDGLDARLVCVPRNYVGSRERCDIAYSAHKELLQGYSNTVLVTSGDVIAASLGYTITKKGRWSYVIDVDGYQVNEKGLSEEDANELLRSL